jgi:hypothetical protein
LPDGDSYVADLDPLAGWPRRDHPVRRRVEAGHLGQQVLRVPAQGILQRGGDLPLQRDAGRAVVGQPLEQVMLGSVDDVTWAGALRSARVATGPRGRHR